MTTDLKDVLKELDSKIAEVYDLGLAEEMTDIYIDLVHRTDLMSRKYWKLVKALAIIEKERDEFREKFKEEELKNRSMKISFGFYGDTAKGMLDEERKLRENVERERDQALYDRNYYRNELDKEIELGTEIEFQKDFLMNKVTGCVDCKGCQICEN